jgi:teichuronic acid biosynthesis glycosyltransferase TuaG
VIIPIYNEENTLLEILGKVNSQSSHDFNLEIIVIDDCSSDSSQKIIESNLNLVSNYIKLEKNGGKGAAVREGLKKSYRRLYSFSRWRFRV